MFLTKEFIEKNLFETPYIVKHVSETSELIVYSVCENENIYILRFYPTNTKEDIIKLFKYLEIAAKENLSPEIITIYENGILEKGGNFDKKKYKPDNVIALINKISALFSKSIGLEKNFSGLPELEFNDIQCIKKISSFIKKIIDSAIKTKDWFSILDKFSQIIDHLMVDYNKKNNTICHNNLSPENFYCSLLDKENISTTNFEHIGTNPVFYELSNYFNNLSSYPQLDERKKYYSLFSKKSEPSILDYIDKHILMYSDISNLYWAFWAHLESYELGEKDVDKYYSKMYDYRIKKFLS